jgi:hypothetical protein
MELALKDFYAATLLNEGKILLLLIGFRHWTACSERLTRLKIISTIFTPKMTALPGNAFKAVQMPHGQNALNTTATSSSIGRIDILKMLIFRRHITRLKSLIHIGSGTGLGRSGFLKAMKRRKVVS